MAKTNASQRTADAASQAVLRTLEGNGSPADLAWDRYEAQQPQCGFGLLGLCCRHCAMGPCRISPFDRGPKAGVCGADADVIAARMLARMIASGSAAHSDHGRDTVQTLMTAAQGQSDYRVKDAQKLERLAEELGIDTDGCTSEQLASRVAARAFGEIGQQTGELSFAQRAPDAQKKQWRNMNAMPTRLRETPG